MDDRSAPPDQRSRTSGGTTLVDLPLTYELTCPGCQTVSRHVFLRLGAVVACTQCKKDISVDDATSKHIQPEIPASGLNPLLLGVTQITRPTAPPKHQGPQASGVGLPKRKAEPADETATTLRNDPTDDNGEAASADKTTADDPATNEVNALAAMAAASEPKRPSAPLPSPQVAQMLAQRRARRIWRQRLPWIVGAGAVAMLMIIAIVAILSQPPVEPHAPGPDVAGAAEPHMVAGERLGDLDAAPPITGDAIFENIQYAALGDGQTAKIVLKATNPLAAPLGYSVFLIQARGADRQAIARWRVEWRRTIKPSEPVELIVPTPLPQGQSVDQWVVTGAGRIGSDRPVLINRNGSLENRDVDVIPQPVTPGLPDGDRD